MQPSPASASNEAPRDSAGAQRAKASSTADRILICGVNWIGDSVMTMPALRAFRRSNPSARIALLVKPGLVPLWKLVPVANEILELYEGCAGTLKTVRAVRAGRFDKAFVFPRSFRSAAIPWLARIPARIGMPGHWRDFMLTGIVRPRERPDRTHQAYEYIDLLAGDGGDVPLELSPIALPEPVAAAARSRLAEAARPCVGLIPGAARGPSKQWPAESFIHLGRLLAEKDGCGLAVMGLARERDLCERVAAAIGRAAINLAGESALVEWIALLKACDLVVANDSGGMHLAAAVGTPVVALFGMTDPARTGPLGPRCRVLQNSQVRSRDIARNSAAARESLASISPEQVYEAARPYLQPAPRT